jgi:hypothetical protein
LQGAESHGESRLKLVSQPPKQLHIANAELRTREYVTVAEVERPMDAARAAVIERTSKLPQS